MMGRGMAALSDLRFLEWIYPRTRVLPVTGPLSSAHGSVGVSRKLYSAPVARGVTFL